MPEFNEQLTAARRAAGLTQEQLSAAVHVTRSTISSWERGRTYPDVAMLRKLSEALGCDLMPAGIGQVPEAPAAEEPAPAERQAAVSRPETVPEEAAPAPAAAPEAPAVPVPARKPRPIWLFPLICVIEAVVLSCFYLFALPAMTRPKVDLSPDEPIATDMPGAMEKAADAMILTEPARFTREWFFGGNVPVKGEPYLHMYTRVEVDTQSSKPFWHYFLVFEEVTGRKFVPEKVDVYEYSTPKNYDHQSCPAERIWAETTGDLWELGGGLPVQDIVGYGFIIYGTDEAGNRLSFRTYLDMTDAPRE